jgi:hypothetical protein
MKVSSRRTSPLALCAAGLTAALVALGPVPSAPVLPPLNEAVVSYARGQLGKQVGDGSCITLAREALRRSGAKRISLARTDGDYVWGRRVERYEDALPGDILQFRDAEFQGKKRLPKRRWISWHSVYPHHTAIVSKVGEGGKLVTVLHQNVGAPDVDEQEKKRVQEGTLRMDSLRKGWVRIYRPQPPDEDAATDP